MSFKVNNILCNKMNNVIIDKVNGVKISTGGGGGGSLDPLSEAINATGSEIVITVSCSGSYVAAPTSSDVTDNTTLLDYGRSLYVSPDAYQDLYVDFTVDSGGSIWFDLIQGSTKRDTDWQVYINGEGVWNQPYIRYNDTLYTIAYGVSAGDTVQIKFLNGRSSSANAILGNLRIESQTLTPQQGGVQS